MCGNRVLAVEISTDLVNGLFGSKLASLRRAKGVSQSELGRRMGVSRTTIANLERGVQNVQLHQVFTLAHALDADPNALIPSWSEVVPENAVLDARVLDILRESLTRLTGGPK